MQSKQLGSAWLLVTLLALAALACGLFTSSADGPPRNAVVTEVTANTSLGPWLTQAVEQFNNSNTRTAGGQTVYVNLELVESGRAVTSIAGGASEPALWIPDEPVWTGVLANEGAANFQNDCVSLATSPLVIAMWRPVAESLGWPGLALGWLDVGSLAADPSAWAYYSGGEFGDILRLSHTHPGLSATGASTLLAIVQAAESKTEAVSVTDIQQPIVQASVSAFEAAVSWFSPSTDSLGQTMRDRGIGYLGAAIMYESTVVAYGEGDPDIVPIYPFEGTFLATHPACINETAGIETREAARLFRDYLLAESAQQLAMASGLRPVNSEVAPGPPLEPSRGVDLNQPQIVFASPSVDSIYAVQELWQSARKDVNLVMLLDVSGSMRGAKMESMRSAAIQFVQQMGSDDFITIIAFSDTPFVVVDHTQVGPGRDGIVGAIRGLSAGGYTALYDAIGDGAEVIARTTSPETNNVMVVLTDGLDTSSSRYRFDQRLIERARANGATIFTIAYGSDADEQLMADLALQANGNYYLGDEASIAAIYEEMSAAFGGTVGVGR